MERIFYLVLKQILRWIGKILDVTEYKKLIELAYLVLVHKREEFFRVFELREKNVHFCARLRILRRDVQSIVYKVLISEGLFPIHCEINTMNDSYLKLKILSLIADSEILPWSPKFHASLGIHNLQFTLFYHSPRQLPLQFHSQ